MEDFGEIRHQTEIDPFCACPLTPSALARNYQGLLTKSDPQRDDRNACFALRQTSGWGFHQFPLSTAFAE